MNKFPNECPFNSELLSNLYWNNSFNKGSASDKATRQFLKSPGGRIPYAFLSLPELPPLSATVITAVKSTGFVRKALSKVERPVPPPIPTIFYFFVN